MFHIKLLFLYVTLCVINFTYSVITVDSNIITLILDTFSKSSFNLRRLKVHIASFTLCAIGNSVCHDTITFIPLFSFFRHRALNLGHKNDSNLCCCVSECTGTLEGVGTGFYSILINRCAEIHNYHSAFIYSAGKCTVYKATSVGWLWNQAFGHNWNLAPLNRNAYAWCSHTYTIYSWYLSSLELTKMPGKKCPVDPYSQCFYVTVGSRWLDIHYCHLNDNM